MLIHNGQLGADELRRANRTMWKVLKSDKEIAGYFKMANNNRFFFAVIRNMVPYDQSRFLLNLIERFLAAQI